MITSDMNGCEIDISNAQPSHSLFNPAFSHNGVNLSKIPASFRVTGDKRKSPRDRSFLRSQRRNDFVRVRSTCKIRNAVPETCASNRGRSQFPAVDRRTPLPKGIDAAHRCRQSVARPVKIDSSGFAIIPRQDSHPCAFVRRKRVMDTSNGFDEFRPANLFAKIAVHFDRLRPPV